VLAMSPGPLILSPAVTVFFGLKCEPERRSRR
jgi:hypothetical protein